MEPELLIILTRPTDRRAHGWLLGRPMTLKVFWSTLIVGMQLIAAGIGPLEAADWFRWRGPELSGASAEVEWSLGNSHSRKLAWQAEVGTGFASFVVSQNRCVTVGHIENQDVVVCLDVDSGKILWDFRYAAALEDRDFEGGPTGTPTIDGMRLFVLSRAGDFFCLDLLTGNQIWNVQVAEAAAVRLPGWGFAASPLIVDSKVILNIGEHGAAFDKSSGKLLWKSADREAGYGTPVPVEFQGKLCAIFPSARAYIGVDLETGTAIWTERWLTTFGCNAADAILFKDQFFLSSGYNRGAALFQLVDNSPQLVWKNKDMQNQLHASLLHDGFLYGIDGDMERGASLTCMRWSTGEVAWTKEDIHPGGLTLAGDRLIVLTADGDLVAVRADPKAYQELERIQVLDGKCWTTPVISDGRIFCRSVSGQVACVDARR